MYKLRDAFLNVETCSYCRPTAFFGGRGLLQPAHAQSLALAVFPACCFHSKQWQQRELPSSVEVHLLSIFLVHFITVTAASASVSLKARVVENVKQIGAWLARTTALAGDASVMRFQAGGLENGDGGARIYT